MIKCGAFICSEFQDIFDVDHFIRSLRGQVRVFKKLPPVLQDKLERGLVPSFPPVSWSNISYYHKTVINCSCDFSIILFFLVFNIIQVTQFINFFQAGIIGDTEEQSCAFE